MKISVIIPTLNEAHNLPSLLWHLQRMPGVSQIVVSDGGSSDATVRLARERGAMVVEGHSGRGAQLNAGARAATGQILWFLHADARPPACAGLEINFPLYQKAARPALGGNFRLHFDAPGLAPRLFELIALCQRRTGICYGDSGLWVRREVFEALGGFRDWPLFEDYDFARRLERHARRNGGRTVCCAGPLVVSARRFQTHPWRTLGLWLWLQLLFALGVPPARLARIYHRRTDG